MSAKDDLKNIKKIRKSMADQVRDLLQAAAKELFDKYPELKSFSWTQYTPSWCDGDPCRFTDTSDYPMINGYDENDGTYGEDEDGNSLEIPDKQAAVIEKEIRAITKEIDRDTLEELFGDGVRVTVTREGIETEDYDCGY